MPIELPSTGSCLSGMTAASPIGETTMKLVANQIYAVWFSEILIDDDCLSLSGIENALVVAHDAEADKLIAFTDDGRLADSQFYVSKDGSWFEILEPYVIKHEVNLKNAFSSDLSTDGLVFLATNTIYQINDDMVDGKQLKFLTHSECENPPKNAKGKKGAWIISAQAELKVDSEKKALTLLGEKINNTNEIIAFLLDQGSQSASYVK
jgi:hypothetical protein